MAAYPYNTARWQRLRTVKLSINPLCEPCNAAGRIEAANTVDHIVPISAGGAAFPSLDGLTSMCTSCHSRKTVRGVEAGAVRTTRAVQPRKGCDANGNPADPAHPWRQEPCQVGGNSLTTGANRTVIATRIQLVSEGKR